LGAFSALKSGSKKASRDAFRPESVQDKGIVLTPIHFVEILGKIDRKLYKYFIVTIW
jgi:hypothetical protein